VWDQGCFHPDRLFRFAAYARHFLLWVRGQRIYRIELENPPLVPQHAEDLAGSRIEGIERGIVQETIHGDHLRLRHAWWPGKDAHNNNDHTERQEYGESPFEKGGPPTPFPENIESAHRKQMMIEKES
jgi:hypothetical protein